MIPKRYRPASPSSHFNVRIVVIAYQHTSDEQPLPNRSGIRIYITKMKANTLRTRHFIQPSHELEFLGRFGGQIIMKIDSIAVKPEMTPPHPFTVIPASPWNMHGIVPVRKTNTARHLPFALPDIGPEEITEVVESLKSGWVTTGPKTARFEKDFAKFIGNEIQALAVNSATAGLHLALEAVGVDRGDEVITSPYTFTATAEVIRYLGAHPKFVDIDPSTFNIDPTKIEAAITDKTKAIIPVHFAGLSCSMGPIIEIARRHGLKIVEDAAHALPTAHNGQLVGALESDVTVFSFYATKTMTTGEGGMIVTKNRDIAERCRIMRLHGISQDVFNRYISTAPSWFYEVVAPGFKYNMTDIAASLGIHQLRKAWYFHRRRSAMSERYDAELSDLPLILPPKAPEGDIHAWHLYVVQLGDNVPITRDRFIEEMAARGISCSVHFIPLHIHPYWRDSYALEPQDYPCALRAYERAVSLPIYTKMTDDDQSSVIEAIRDILI